MLLVRRFSAFVLFAYILRRIFVKVPIGYIGLVEKEGSTTGIITQCQVLTIKRVYREVMVYTIFLQQQSFCRYGLFNTLNLKVQMYAGYS